MPGMTGDTGRRAPSASRASMRPRLNAGDDAWSAHLHPPAKQASMRPRLNAGDDSVDFPDLPSRCCRFNEAPAKCRG